MNWIQFIQYEKFDIMFWSEGVKLFNYWGFDKDHDDDDDDKDDGWMMFVIGWHLNKQKMPITAFIDISLALALIFFFYFSLLFLLPSTEA